MVGIGNFAAGLLKGMAQSKQRKAQAEAQAEQNKQNKMLFELKKRKMDSDSEMQSFKLSFLKDLLEKNKTAQTSNTLSETPSVQNNLFEQAKPEEVSFGDSFSGVQMPQERPQEQPQEDVISQIVNGQQGQQSQPQQPFGGMEPQDAALAQWATNIPFLPAITQDTAQKSLIERKRGAHVREQNAKNILKETKRANQVNEELKQDRFNFDQSKVVWRKKVINGETWMYPFTPLGQPISQDKAEPYRESKKQGKSVETGTKLQSMQAGVKGIQAVRQMITNPDGTINKAALSQLKPLPFFNKATPDWLVKMYSDAPPVGMRMFTLLNQAYESLVRGESGAAVPPEELQRLAARYGIDWTQDDNTINLRLDQLQTILSGTVKTIDPNDLFLYNPEDIAKRVYQDGRVEHVLLPQEDGSMPTPVTNLQDNDPFDGFTIKEVK